MKSLLNFDEKNIKCSSKQFLKDIDTPTLIIHSNDNPFMNTNILLSNEELSSKITFELYKHGGHVGFISGTIFKPRYWLDTRITKFIKN